MLVSGGGTNLQALIDGVEDKKILASIASVISSKPDAFALVRAQQHGIKTRVINKKRCGSQEACDAALLAALREDGADFVVLAGYLSILGAPVIHAYRNKILNIHPALLPAFGGRGYYGIHVHEAVLAARVPVTGATVHFVDEGTDTGPVVMQRIVVVEPNDTPESLQQRVLEIEHQILIRAVSLMAQGRIHVHSGEVHVLEQGEACGCESGE